MQSDDQPKQWTREQSAEIADHWQKMLDAADAGDERGKDFLATFGPWAREQLARRDRVEVGR